MPQPGEPPITALSFTPDGKHVVAGSQAGLIVYDWPELKRRRKIEAAPVNIHDLAFSPSGDRLAVAGGAPGERGVVEILSWPNGERIHVLEKHEDLVMGIAWRDESALASASLDRNIILWDTTTGTLTRRLEGHSRGVTSVRFIAVSDRQSAISGQRSANRKLVSVGRDHSVRVWDVESGELVRSLNQHTQAVHALALRPVEDGLPMVASAAADRTIRFWQPTIGRMVRFIRLDAEPLSIAWLSRSHIAAACSDGRIRVVDADAVKVVRDAPAVDGWAYALAIHPSDSHVLVGGTLGQLQLLGSK